MTKDDHSFQNHFVPCHSIHLADRTDPGVCGFLIWVRLGRPEIDPFSYQD